MTQAKAVIGGLAHDRFIGLGRNGRSEFESAEYAYAAMRDSSVFSLAHCEDVRRAIMDTTCHPSGDSIGQNPQTELGKVLADADLSYFGMATYEAWPLAEDYFTETHPGASLVGPEFGRFAERFAAILARHRFQLAPTAVLYPHRLQNADYATSVSHSLLAA